MPFFVVANNGIKKFSDMIILAGVYMPSSVPAESQAALRKFTMKDCGPNFVLGYDSEVSGVTSDLLWHI